MNANTSESKPQSRVIPLKLIEEYLDDLKIMALQELRKKEGDKWKSQSPTDVLHSVFANLLKKRGEEGSCKEYEFRIAMEHHLIDKHRRRSALKRPTSDSPTTLEDAHDLLVAPPPIQLPMEFESALEALAQGDGKTPALIDVFRLLYDEGLSVKEAASKLDCSDSTVKRRYHDALGCLRDHLSR